MRSEEAMSQSARVRQALEWARAPLVSPEVARQPWPISAPVPQGSGSKLESQRIEVAAAFAYAARFSRPAEVPRPASALAATEWLMVGRVKASMSVKVPVYLKVAV